jgi:hypothetical protein
MKSPRINPKWYQLSHMSELAEYLQSVPSFELTKKVALEISEKTLAKNPRRIVIENFIHLAKQFMGELFVELGADLEYHFDNYPFIRTRIPFAAYDSTKGRVTYQKVQSFLRKIPMIRRGFLPRKIRNHVVPIVLPGVDYSAESLVHSLSLKGEELPDKSRLGWQHLDTYADYCLDVMALGRETYASLIDAWYFGQDSDTYFKALETLAEEMLHHISDEIAGPRYGERSVAREHYWMKSYGEFPEKLDIALLRLKDEYLGRLKEKILTREGKGEPEPSHLLAVESK